MCNAPLIPYDGAKVIQVIVTTLLRRGEGRTAGDPIRVITQYWSMDGQLLAQVDPTDSIGQTAAA